LGNQRVRAKNLGLECFVDVDDDDLYGKLMERQEKIHSVAAAFRKLNQQLRKNGRTMFSGKSGNAINQLFATHSFDPEDKYVIAFRKPSKPSKLTQNKKSFTLSNIYVAAARLEIIDGIPKSYLPLATVVGPGKTTSFSPVIVDIVKTFAAIFGTNFVVIFDFKKQKLGFVRESEPVLKDLAKFCSLMPSSFQIDQWNEYACFHKFNPLFKTISGTNSELFFNGSKRI
jgi:hypothetical protein